MLSAFAISINEESLKVSEPLSISEIRERETPERVASVSCDIFSSRRRYKMLRPICWNSFWNIVTANLLFSNFPAFILSHKTMRTFVLYFDSLCFLSLFYETRYENFLYFCVFIIRWMHSLVVSPQDTITIFLFNLSTRKGHLFWVFLSALKERLSPQIFLFPWLFDVFGGRNPGLSFYHL